MLTAKKKKLIINKFKTSENDTGSSPVQVAILSRQIEDLSTHLKKHKKDNHSRRGLIKMVADRRTMLKYLEKKDKKAYDKVVKELAL